MNMIISYNWLKEYVPTLPDAKALADVFMYHLCEVESIQERGGDTIFDLNILPNRAHDLLSHQGIARELAGQLGISFKDPTVLYKTPISKETALSVVLHTKECRRYTARIIRNVKVQPSPQWMATHLQSIGARSINNVVDATNIVLFDCGQPCHAFDAKKLSNESITVRMAKKDEAMTTLDGKAISFLETDMVIADDDGVLAIAGVKGGTKAEVDTNTVDIILEVANFAPVGVRKTARRIGLLTDAAKRFENDLSPDLAIRAMQQLSALIAELCPDAVFEDIVDVYPAPQEYRQVSFSLSRVNTVLGATITSEDVEAILRSYGFIFSRVGESFSVDVPPLRLDLVGEHDMIEEIGRIYGYEKIIPVLPDSKTPVEQNEIVQRIHAARRELVEDGYKEVYTYTFTKKGDIQVAYGAKGKEYIRTNLSEGLRSSYELNRQNAPLLGQREIKLFEIGAVFSTEGNEVINVAYADNDGVVEESLATFTEGMDLSLEDIPVSLSTEKFVPWSVYPFVVRDIAVWSNEADRELLQSIVATFASEHCVRPPELFDSFEKEGRISIAYRFVFQAQDKTLTDDEVNTTMQTLYNAIVQSGAFEIR